MIFHEQQECGYDFPSLLTSGHVWRSHSCSKIIPAHLLRHVWPKIVMENHTHTPAVHGKSFHKGLTKQSLFRICVYTNMHSFLCKKIFKNLKSLAKKSPDNFRQDNIAGPHGIYDMRRRFGNIICIRNKK